MNIQHVTPQIKLEISEGPSVEKQGLFSISI